MVFKKLSDNEEFGLEDGGGENEGQLVGFAPIAINDSSHEGAGDSIGHMKLVDMTVDDLLTGATPSSSNSSPGLSPKSREQG